MTEIKLTGELLVDGLPIACGECGTTLNLTATVSRIPIASWPAWINCPTGHGSESPVLTNGMVAAINVAAGVRLKATDDQAFRTEVDGHLVEGELCPDWCIDDFRRGAQVLWRRGLKPQLRRKWRGAKRTATGKVREAGHATAEALVYTPFAAAAGAAWNARIGIADPSPAPVPRANRCPSCKGKGVHRLDTRFHDSPDVDCALCSGTGRADAI